MVFSTFRIMEQEKFEISFAFKGQTYQAEVKTVMPNGPENADHEIWINGNYLFTVNPNQNEWDSLLWRAKERDIDPEFVAVIGDAIGRHYL